MLPSAMPSRISSSQTCRWSSSGSRIITRSPRLAASTTGSTSRPCSRRLRDGGRVGTQPDDDVDAGVLEVERVGVALRAVADDGDGLAVEEAEVCVVVVDHCAAGYPTGAGDQASARATSVRPGSASAPPVAGVGGEPGRQRLADLADLRVRAREHGIVKAPREVERQLPELLEARVVAEHLDGADVDLGEAGLLEQPAQQLLAAERERPGPGRTAGDAAWGVMPCSRSYGRGQSRPGVLLDRVPDRQPGAPAGPQHAPGLAERCRGVGHQHVAVAAEHDVHARQRQVDPFGVQDLELDVLRSRARRPGRGPPRASPRPGRRSRPRPRARRAPPRASRSRRSRRPARARARRAVDRPPRSSRARRPRSTRASVPGGGSSRRRPPPSR